MLLSIEQIKELPEGTEFDVFYAGNSWGDKYKEIDKVLKYKNKFYIINEGWRNINSFKNVKIPEGKEIIFYYMDINTNECIKTETLFRYKNKVYTVPEGFHCIEDFENEYEYEDEENDFTLIALMDKKDNKNCKIEPLTPLEVPKKKYKIVSIDGFEE